MCKCSWVVNEVSNESFFAYTYNRGEGTKNTCWMWCGNVGLYVIRYSHGPCELMRCFIVRLCVPSIIEATLLLDVDFGIEQKREYNISAPKSNRML